MMKSSRAFFAVTFIMLVSAQSTFGTEMFRQAQQGAFFQRMLQQQQYNSWFVTLPPRMQQLEVSINNIYDNYERESGVTIPYSEQNVYQMAAQLGADETDLPFIAHRMQSISADRQRFNNTMGAVQRHLGRTDCQLQARSAQAMAAC